MDKTSSPLYVLLEKKPAIEKHLLELINKIKSLQIKNDADAGGATELGILAKKNFKRIEEMRTELVKPLNDQVHEINVLAKSLSAPFVEAETMVKAALKRYLDEKDRLARLEAKRLRKEQEEKDRIEREKLEEARQKEEAARLALQKAEGEAFEAKSKKEREAAEKRAAVAAAEAEAERAKAEAAQEKIDTAVAPVVEEPSKSIRTGRGISTRKLEWKWTLEDRTLALKMHPELFIVDEKAMNKLVQDGERDLAGFKIFQESSISLRA